METNLAVKHTQNYPVDYQKEQTTGFNDAGYSNHKLVKLMKNAGEVLSQNQYLEEISSDLRDLDELSALDIDSQEVLTPLHIKFTQQMHTHEYTKAAHTYIDILNQHRPSAMFSYGTPMTMANVCDRLCEGIILNGVGHVVMQAAYGACRRLCESGLPVRCKEDTKEEEIGEKETGSSDAGQDQGKVCSVSGIKFDIPEIFKIFEYTGYKVAYLNTHEEILKIEIEVTLFEKRICCTFCLFDDPSKKISLEKFSTSDLRLILDHELRNRHFLDKIPRYVFLNYDHQYREFKLIRNEHQPLSKLFEGNSFKFHISYFLGSLKNQSLIMETELDVVKLNTIKREPPLYFVVAPDKRDILYETLLDLVKLRYIWNDLNAFDMPITNIRLYDIIERACISNTTFKQNTFYLESLKELIADGLNQPLPLPIHTTIMTIEYPPKQDLYRYLFGNKMIDDVENNKSDKFMVMLFTRQLKSRVSSQSSKINTAAVMPADGNNQHVIGESQVQHCTTSVIESLDSFLICQMFMIMEKINDD
jgi:hypothetical protein